MVDGSYLPFKEHLSYTKEIAALAHAKDMLVELELGRLSGNKDELSFDPSQILLKQKHGTMESFMKALPGAIPEAVDVISNNKDPLSLVRDHRIKELLSSLGVAVHSFNADLLYEPWEVADENCCPFLTFEPFWNKYLSMPYDPAAPLLPPKMITSEMVQDVIHVQAEKLQQGSEITRVNQELIAQSEELLREEARKKILLLEKQLDAKQKLELEIIQLKGNLQVMKHMGGDDSEVCTKIEELN